ncbi:T9SS type A sorting domain-containing protein [Hymenobacter aerophilus]|uniref:T9SS type A sorting domain-containing protein n=1 Tax=Hymenobacter aerophilus TaxID=119644 RepID=UPI0003814119|nr:T9SS type A sorting domain-containing protein [Hymenobacter aerophilus]
MKFTPRFFTFLLLLLWQLPQLAAASYAPPSAAQGRAPVAGVPTLAARMLSPTFSLAPNPAHGIVTLSMSQYAAGTEYRLRLSNIIGREVRTVALRPEAADRGMSLNLADLPSGMYFYSLLQNDKVVSTKRLVLQN